MHLLTHGFFKAGLFLGAGSVMHAMNDEVDMRQLRRARRAIMPITFATFGLGYLALIGFPFRVRLLLQGRDHRGRVRRSRAGAAGCSAAPPLLAAGLTAFYMTRLMLMTFFGEQRWKELKSADGQRLPPARVAGRR